MCIETKYKNTTGNTIFWYRHYNIIYSFYSIFWIHSFEFKCQNVKIKKKTDQSFFFEKKKNYSIKRWLQNCQTERGFLLSLSYFWTNLNGKINSQEDFLSHQKLTSPIRMSGMKLKFGFHKRGVSTNLLAKCHKNLDLLIN